VKFNLMHKLTMEKKRFYLSETDKKIAGVCGGIAEYFDIDPCWCVLVSSWLSLAWVVACWATLPFGFVPRRIPTPIKGPLPFYI